VYIPNAFTPNSDERNDAWSWVGDCDPEEFLLMVFNRWGELIYSTEDPLAKWDGTYQGTVSQDGVYVYRVRYRLPYQARKDLIGHVTLLR
jgi:gliding motility-associated-like protein